MSLVERRAESRKYGESKKRYVFMLTQSVSEAVDKRADALGISRSEVLEQVLRAGGLDLIGEEQLLKKPCSPRSRPTDPPCAA